MMKDSKYLDYRFNKNNYPNKLNHFIQSVDIKKIINQI